MSDSKHVFHVSVKENYYRDSLQLLKISDSLKHSDGIVEAVVIMGTETNKQLLTRLGFISLELNKAKDTDMVIAIRALDEQSLKKCLVKFEEILEGAQTSLSQKERVRDLDSALVALPDTNLAVVSIPGEYARDICFEIIDKGIHLHLFSDHVPIEDELEIKKHALEKHVLVMGPGAGTVIIDGKGVGFANVVSAGPVGLVAAAGTGLQEVSSLLDRTGIGLKHGLGVGGNDPKEKIGGLMMLESIKMLEKYDEIKVVGIISKPPSPSVQNKLFNYIVNETRKKYAIAFIGGVKLEIPKEHQQRIIQTNTLHSAALAIAKHMSEETFRKASKEISVPSQELAGLIKKESEKLDKKQSYIRALYTGGTLAYESQIILREIFDGIFSNEPIEGIKKLPDSFKSQEHTIVDLGDEEFTKGRPHPMIDPTIRKLKIIEEARDENVAVILMDFVLGYGSNPDPVGALVDKIIEAKDIAKKNGRYLSVVASVCGTRKDPQGYDKSVERLKATGALVTPTNALAVIAAGSIASRGSIKLEELYSKFLTTGE